MIKKNYFLFIIILIGLLLRLIWINDMEWKDDEKWMYSKAHEVVHTGEFPAVGMQSGGGIVNPGMSVGVFAVIAAFTNDPLEMNRVVQIINILSILGFIFFIFRRVEEKERNTWLIGLTLAAISPLAVLFSRKIWAQDLLPAFSFIIILANSHRSKRWGAFVWGLAGALIGQVHMSGFFFAAGLFIFTLVYDHYNKIKFRWFYFIAGSVIGSITLIPWISFILNNPQINRQSFWHIFQFNFFYLWFIDSQGLNIMYSIRKEFWQFIKEPFVGEVPTYMIAVLHSFLVAASFYTLKELWKFVNKSIQFYKERKPFESIFLNISTTRFYLLSILLGLGILMTLCGTTIYAHYLICAFPFSYIFLAKILQHRKRLLHGIIISQLFLTSSYLVYIHNHHGIATGDYGITYKEQMRINNSLNKSATPLHQ